MEPSKRPLTYRNISLLVPITLLIFVPLWLIQLALQAPITPVVLVAWAVICFFKSGDMLWWMSDFIPPFRRYLLWSRK